MGSIFLLNVQFLFFEQLDNFCLFFLSFPLSIDNWTIHLSCYAIKIIINVNSPNVNFRGHSFQYL